MHKNTYKLYLCKLHSIRPSAQTWWENIPVDLDMIVFHIPLAHARKKTRNHFLKPKKISCIHAYMQKISRERYLLGIKGVMQENNTRKVTTIFLYCWPYKLQIPYSDHQNFPKIFSGTLCKHINLWALLRIVKEQFRNFEQ